MISVKQAARGVTRGLSSNDDRRSKLIEPSYVANGLGDAREARLTQRAHYLHARWFRAASCGVLGSAAVEARTYARHYYYSRPSSGGHPVQNGVLLLKG